LNYRSARQPQSYEEAWEKAQSRRAMPRVELAFELNQPNGLALDSAGNLYICDTGAAHAMAAYVKDRPVSTTEI
jgi:sugar lactone lactonase YvrE